MPKTINPTIFETIHFNFKLFKRYINNPIHPRTGNKYKENLSVHRKNPDNQKRETTIIEIRVAYSIKLIIVSKYTSKDIWLKVYDKSLINKFIKAVLFAQIIL